MGHALNNSIQDCLIRFNRMRAKRTKWILGTDHAGIATQTQVERALIAEGTSREAARPRGVRRARVAVARASTAARSSSSSSASAPRCDYDDERFTLDDRYARAVQHVFVALVREGLHLPRPVHGQLGPGHRSAISDLEVEDREVEDTLYYIDYPLASGSGAVTVATVRPETMLADTAIAVHPDDERYRRLIGEKAILPLVGRKLTIIADDYVKPDFGTGALKITPGHDPNDFEIGRRHGLQQISVIGEDGRITAEAPERFAGMTVEEARQAVVAELRERGADRADRGLRPRGALLAPLGRADRAADLAAVVHADGRAGQARDRGRQERSGPLLPESYTPRVPRLDGEHPPLVRLAPAVVGAPDPGLVPRTCPPGVLRRRDAARGRRLGARPDVLDTWFAPALWPFATLGWPEDTPALRAFYPTDVLSTGRDIMFLWVARMIMMGFEFIGEAPVQRRLRALRHPGARRAADVQVAGHRNRPARADRGGPRPPAFEGGGDFPAYGADAVRFGLFAMSSAQDVRFGENPAGPGAAAHQQAVERRAAILLRGSPRGHAPLPKPAAVEDRWILCALLIEAGHRRRDQGLRLRSCRASPIRLRLWGAL